jgi:hypothetical protein
MAANKKPRKQRNHVESVRKRNEFILRNYCLAQITSLEHDNATPRLFNLQQGIENKLSENFKDALSAFPYQWIIHLCVGCEDSKGNNEIKEVVVAPPGCHFYYNIWDSVASYHKKMINELLDKRVRIKFIGLISRPSGRELQSEEIYSLFDKLGGWKLGAETV